MNGNDKPLVWLHGEIKTPPFSLEARIEAGTLLRLLQGGASIEVFPKKTGTTPKKVIDTCKRRFNRYDEATK